MNVAGIPGKQLRRHEVSIFFAVATLVYILPLILADYLYIDDNWRSQAAGTAWEYQGRLLSELFYKVLSFTSGAPDLFPLPLLLATLAMALALTSLTLHYYKSPDLSCCLVLLPVWYSPFFLQNLSYQYDGPVMTLSVVAVIYAITFKSRYATLRIAVPGALIAAALAFYQLSINVFFGLCCIEFVRGINDKKPLARLTRLVGGKAAQVGLGLAIYYLTAYQLMTHERMEMIPFNADGLFLVQGNARVLMEKIALLFHGGMYVFAWAIVLLASGGGALLGWRLILREEPVVHKIILGGLGVLAVPALIVLVSGAALLFRSFNEGARTLMGFAVLLVFLFYLSHQLLTAMHPRLGLLLAIPLLSLLALSYAYGRVLNVQKEFGLNAEFNLAYDIVSNPRLREAKRIYMAINYSNSWLLGARGTLERLPVLNYILNINFYMLSENLRRVGITNVVTERERRNATLVGYRGYTPVVDSKFYNIYLVGDYGFIVMKEVPSATSDKW